LEVNFQFRRNACLFSAKRISYAFQVGVAMTKPFRILDYTGRSLHWVMIAGPTVHKIRSEWDACKVLAFCPRPSPNEVPDLVTRPFHSEDGMYFRLSDEMHQWLEDANLPYQLEFRYVGMTAGWHVGFREKEQAAMFKLSVA
jgi:hypothetical protein